MMYSIIPSEHVCHIGREGPNWLVYLTPEFGYLQTTLVILVGNLVEVRGTEWHSEHPLPEYIDVQTVDDPR